MAEFKYKITKLPAKPRSKQRQQRLAGSGESSSNTDSGAGASEEYIRKSAMVRTDMLLPDGETSYLTDEKVPSAAYTETAYAKKQHTHPIADVANLQNSLDNKASAGHTHSQYLTEHQDISGKADVNHIHKIEDVTGLQDALDAKQGAGSFAMSSHTHDDRYYTETEVDTKLVQKSDTTHNHDNAYQPKGNYLTAHQDISGKEDKANKKTSISASPSDANYLSEKAVAEALATKAGTNHTHTKAQITDFPASMPASDVYPWAKAASKPNYTATEVGALPSTGGGMTGDIVMGGGLNGGAVGLSSDGYKFKFISVPNYIELSVDHEDDVYFKALVKWICQKYPNEQYTIFQCNAQPNAYSLCQISIYNTSDVNSEGYPNYAYGWEKSLDGHIYNFSFSAYVWSWKRVANIDEIPSALKNPNALTVRNTSNLSAYYDGSSAVEFDVNPSYSIQNDFAGTTTDYDNITWWRLFEFNGSKNAALIHVTGSYNSPEPCSMLLSFCFDRAGVGSSCTQLNCDIVSAQTIRKFRVVYKAGERFLEVGICDYAFNGKAINNLLCFNIWSGAFGYHWIGTKTTAIESGYSEKIVWRAEYAAQGLIADHLRANYYGYDNPRTPNSIGDYKAIVTMEYLSRHGVNVTGYTDTLFMNAYNGFDVPYKTYIGVLKAAEPRAFIGSGNGNNATDWNVKELATQEWVRNSSSVRSAHLGDGMTYEAWGTSYINSADMTDGILIKLPFAVNSDKMFQFTVRIYSAYIVTNIVFSGYLYNGYIYRPSAIMEAGTLPRQVKMGYDSSKNAHVWIAGPNHYAGVAVTNIVSGFHAGDWSSGWTITGSANGDEITAANLDTTVYPPATADHTHTIADVANLQDTLDGKAVANHTHYSLTPQEIPANADLNSYTTPGMYYCRLNATVETLANVPSGLAFSLFVEKHAGTKQTLTEYPSYGARTWMRNLYDGVWGSWRRCDLLPGSHTHTKSDITDFPTSLPASDVQSWAKAASKPTYTAAEVGALAVGGTATNSQKVGGKTIAVVTALPSSPDANTIYFVTS